jgi:hypothetical protein
VKPCCGMCKKALFDKTTLLGSMSWAAGHELKYPLITNKHDCKDFEYDQTGDMIRPTLFNQADLPECTRCAHEFKGICDGKAWVPIKRNPECEFFRDKSLTCRHAIPFLQYGSGIRKNRCSLPVNQRKTEARRGENFCCHNAHRNSSMECYEPTSTKKAGR